MQSSNALIESLYEFNNELPCTIKSNQYIKNYARSYLNFTSNIFIAHVVENFNEFLTFCDQYVNKIHVIKSFSNKNIYNIISALEYENFIFRKQENGTYSLIFRTSAYYSEINDTNNKILSKSKFEKIANKIKYSNNLLSVLIFKFCREVKTDYFGFNLSTLSSSKTLYDYKDYMISLNIIIDSNEKQDIEKFKELYIKLYKKIEEINSDKKAYKDLYKNCFVSLRLTKSHGSTFYFGEVLNYFITFNITSPKNSVNYYSSELFTNLFSEFKSLISISSNNRGTFKSDIGEHPIRINRDDSCGLGGDYRNKYSTIEYNSKKYSIENAISAFIIDNVYNFYKTNDIKYIRLIQKFFKNMKNEYNAFSFFSYMISHVDYISEIEPKLLECSKIFFEVINLIFNKMHNMSSINHLVLVQLNNKVLFNSFIEYYISNLKDSKESSIIMLNILYYCIIKNDLEIYNKIKHILFKNESFLYHVLNYNIFIPYNRYLDKNEMNTATTIISDIYKFVTRNVQNKEILKYLNDENIRGNVVCKELNSKLVQRAAEFSRVVFSKFECRQNYIMF